MKITFITGNQSKADFLAKYLGHPVKHVKLDLDEIQSLESEKIAEHKARQAYEIIGSPVLVEDVSVSIKALGRLPGPFVKWFEQELGLEGIIGLLKNATDRSATVGVVYAYFDGKMMRLFKDQVHGTIAQKPGHGGYDFGWNPIFIPHGSNKTFAQMNEDEVEKYSLRTRKVYPELRKFLADIDPAPTADRPK
ncbi:MAG TPA: non-canonical purine NTP pyrophosphatase [Candidatus Saccharimonadales bacterium]|nr:non-canonical purine NTP pyrophosphatase [Candidatus Saccharimonadales bacterium]